ncbi:MAG: DUF4157 domain-containing protein [Pseudomonadota bacterium]
MTRKTKHRTPKKTGSTTPPRHTPTKQGNGSATHAAPALALPSIQRKLAVGKAGDAYEREADAVADRVMSGQPSPSISRIPAAGLGSATQSKEMEGEEKETAQTQRMEEEEEAAQTQRMEEEEEAAQAQRMEEEEDTAQTQRTEEEEETAQTQRMEEEEEAAQTQRMEEEEEAQAKSAGAAQHENRADAERAMRMRGAGNPIPETVRSQIEHSTGSDLSDVRVHDDTRAQQAAKDLNARAFASGRDIWLGKGESPTNTRLIAHEAAHVVQQTGKRATGAAAHSGASAVSRNPVQRTNGAPPASVGLGHGSFSFPGGTFTVPSSGRAEMVFDELRLPSFGNKSTMSAPFVLTKTTGRQNQQIGMWLEGVTLTEETVGGKLANYTPPAIEGHDDPDQLRDPLFFLEPKGTSQKPLVGTMSSIADNSKIPNWQEDGLLADTGNNAFQVDHLKELQVGGADDLPNLQLLTKVANQRARLAIEEEMRDSIQSALTNVMRQNRNPPQNTRFADIVAGATTRRGAASFNNLRENLDNIDLEVRYRQASSTPSNKRQAPSRDDSWSKDQIERGDHIDALEPITDLTRIERLLGGGSRPGISFFYAGQVSNPLFVPLRNGEVPDDILPELFSVQRTLSPVSMISPVHSGGPETVTALHLELFTRSGDRFAPYFHEVNEEIPVTRMGAAQTAYMIPGNITQQIAAGRLRARAFSPVAVTSAKLGPSGIEIIGQLQFTIPMMKQGTTADLKIDTTGVELSKTFSAGEFDLPGPVSIKDTSLTLALQAGRRGVGVTVDGDMNFDVDRVGTGNLHGRAGSQTGFSLEGSFEFDPALFQGADASISVRYEENKFSGEGTIRIGADQIKGIESAELNVSFEDDIWSATGTVVPKIPGISEGHLEMTFNPDGGFEITGRLTLGSDIPRVKGGYLEATLRKEDDAYILSGRGSAEFDIPGVTSAITAEYRDGLFRAEATVGFERGLAKGTLTVGATNMPIDDGSGEPAGEPTETVSIYGSGSVTIKFTPWLEGTAGISMDQTGAIEVTGRVALPDSVEVFPEKKIEKEILSIGVDIPIVGVAVAGQRIGIFLNIEGNLTARAAIGPGELKDVAVDVTYNPEDESQTRITGTGRFVIPADAGLRLGISGALGAGIPIVSARAGLEVGGELGITGEASASATVEWTPQNGINMEARASVEAQPKFTFDLTGFVDVSADLVLDTVELYSKRWQLASVEFGSNMTFGAALTARVENNEFQPISTDDIEFTTPEVNPIDAVKGLIRSIA